MQSKSSCFRVKSEFIFSQNTAKRKLEQAVVANSSVIVTE